jgi:hypothetical protein
VVGLARRCVGKLGVEARWEGGKRDVAGMGQEIAASGWIRQAVR